MTHSTSDDEENAQVGSGGVSGCGLDGVSGFGSGSGGCEPVVMEEVEECVADPMYPSSTIVGESLPLSLSPLHTHTHTLTHTHIHTHTHTHTHTLTHT